MNVTDSMLVAGLTDALASCPSCGADVMDTSGPEQGIPDGFVFEARFQCGAAVFVSEDAELSVGAGCPEHLDNKLAELRDEVVETVTTAAEAAADGDPA